MNETEEYNNNEESEDNDSNALSLCEFLKELLVNILNIRIRQMEHLLGLNLIVM